MRPVVQMNPHKQQVTLLHMCMYHTRPQFKCEIFVAVPPPRADVSYIMFGTLIRKGGGYVSVHTCCLPLSTVVARGDQLTHATMYKGTAVAPILGHDVAEGTRPVSPTILIFCGAITASIMLTRRTC